MRLHLCHHGLRIIHSKHLVIIQQNQEKFIDADKMSDLQTFSLFKK